MHLMALSDFWLVSGLLLPLCQGKNYVELPVTEEPLPTCKCQYRISDLQDSR